MRFDNPPRQMKDLRIPVIHLSELICLALGIEPAELYLDLYMTKVDSVLEKIGMDKENSVEKYFDIQELKSHCEACRKECTAAVYTRELDKVFDPLDVVDKLLEGGLDEVLSGDEIWMCLQGYAMPKRSGVRKRMNISEAPKIDATQIKGILKRAKEDGADDK